MVVDGEGWKVVAPNRAINTFVNLKDLINKAAISDKSVFRRANCNLDKEIYQQNWHDHMDHFDSVYVYDLVYLSLYAIIFSLHSILKAPLAHELLRD